MKDPRKAQFKALFWRKRHILHTGPYWAMKVLGIDSREGRETRHIENGGREVLNNVRTVFGGVRFPSGGKGGQA